MRVALVLGGLVHGVPQLEVRDHAGSVARVDLGYERERLAVEYDGAWHADRLQLTRDRERFNRLQRAGWEVLVITAPMLRRPHLVVDAVGTALARRRRSLAA
jgi:very-short-patch-repair endonuclease